uniref:Uncharacterized protein n=1 Tax=Candidatus Kentrum sp. FW TaxID=2126338 RepID=A0A450TXU4_9GAMM|nr:MAG: hypothetical protein BECKFW1821C_GA0114237_106011 [Candidatus Kentron sp. FW]
MMNRRSGAQPRQAMYSTKEKPQNRYSLCRLLSFPEGLFFIAGKMIDQWVILIDDGTGFGKGGAFHGILPWIGNRNDEKRIVGAILATYRSMIGGETL